MSAVLKPEAVHAPALVSGFGKTHTNKVGAKDRRPYVAITWEAIQELVDNPQEVLKERAQWVIPSTLASRAKEEQQALGQYWALWADFDESPGPISTVADMLDLLVLGSDVNRELYSSRSATADVQKSRALVPLAYPLSAVDWLACQRILNAQLAQCGLIPDSVTENENQLCFLPNRGAFYETNSRRDGVPFDPLTSWAPQIAQERARIAQDAAAKAKLQEQREEARKRRLAQQEASCTGGVSLIQAFNEAYTPIDFMLEAGYEEGPGDSFRHPGSKSGSYSASVRAGADGLLRVHSLSSTDPLYTGGGGGGAHDAFSAFTELNHGGNRDAALKDAGDNWLKIGGQSWNKVKQREFMQDKSRSTAANDPDDESGGVGAEEDVDEETGEVKAKKVHPLARYLDIGDGPEAPDCIIPGYVDTGLVTWAGARGIGKSTVLVPLAMTAAGLHEVFYELAPEPDRWRHVVYITEDPAQVNRIVWGMLSSEALGLNPQMVRDRFHIVAAMRMDVEVVAQVGKTYRNQWTRVVDGVEILPLVVVDTKSAVLAMDDDSANAESSRIVAVLKQGFEGLPTWIIGHVSKEQVGRSEVSTLSMRGASSFEADANQCLYIIQEGEGDNAQRYISRGKTRFEAKWSDLVIEGFTHDTTAKDKWGKDVEVVLRWAIAKPATQSRAQAKAVAKAAAKVESVSEVHGEIEEAVQKAWEAGAPLNRAMLKAQLGRKGETVRLGVEALLADGWLYEVPIPSAQRVHPNKGSFLVCLDIDEKERFRADGTLPEAKLVIPPTWKKAVGKEAKGPIPSGPAPIAESAVVGVKT